MSGVHLTYLNIALMVMPNPFLYEIIKEALDLS